MSTEEFLRYPNHYPFDPPQVMVPPSYPYPNAGTCVSGDSEIYRREHVGSLGQQWQSTQFYSSLNVPTHSRVCVPIHAPAPLPAPVPIIMPGFGFQDVAGSLDHSTAALAGSPSPPSFSCGPELLAHVRAGSVLEGPPLQTSPSKYEIGFSEKYSPMIPTFPTPSELLCEIKSSDGTTSPESDSNERGPSPPMLQPLESQDSFPIGQPSKDGISSHEKKRQLLECLEQYVIYLHEQLILLGAEPESLERVDNHRGLGSRSIRTLLLHMESTNEELNHKVIAEEERFLKLREEYCKHDPFTSPRNNELGSRGIDPYV